MTPTASQHTAVRIVIVKVCAAFLVWLASLMLIVNAVHFRHAWVSSLPGSRAQGRSSIAADMCSWDGNWYAEISSTGYKFVRGKQCNVVYFPSYPLIARGVGSILGLSPELSLLVTANAFLFGGMLLFQLYLEHTRQAGCDRRWRWYTLLVFAVFPTTFFFRMGYTESALVFFIMLAMLGMRKGWHPLLVALVIGVGTATRSVGISLLLPFSIFLWVSVRNRVRRAEVDGAATEWPTASCIVAWGLRCMLLFPIACWGLLAFMVYQRVAFGSAFAFVEAQRMWHVRVPPMGVFRSLGSWFSGEPLWSTYVPRSPCYWGSEQPVTEPLLNMEFANPIYFAATAGLTLYGIKKRWLSAQEAILCFGLLCIPYVLQTGRQGMISEGRFSAVAFPVYIVIGHILARSHWAVAVYALLCSAGLMAVYAMLFASGYSFF